MTITLNLTPGGVAPRINIKQGNYGGEHVFDLVDGSVGYTLPTGANVVMQGTKPDKTGFNCDCTFDGSTVTAPIIQQSTICAGTVRCELMISDGSDSNIRSATFELIVAAAALDDDTIISTDDYQSTQAWALAAADSAATATSAASAAQESATGAESSASTASSAASAAQESATGAESSASTASSAASAAQEGATAAASSASAASSAASAAQSSATSAAESAALAQSIAQGAKGFYATAGALTTAHPTGIAGEWAIVGTTDTIWIFDAETSAWIDSSSAIDLTDYYTKEQANARYLDVATYGGSASGIVGQSDTASNASKLGGELPAHYAAAQDVENITDGTTSVGDANKLGGEPPTHYAAASTLGGCWISFTDADGNATDTPYIHWYEDDGT